MTITVVKTIRASGGDYTTLSAWEAANQGNLVTADEIRVAECYNDWLTGLNDSLYLDGWTTDTTRYIKITVAAGHRHNGTPESGFHIKKSASYATIVSSNYANYTIYEWLDIQNTSTGDSAHAFLVQGEGCVAKSCLVRSAGAGVALIVGSNTSKAIDCLAWGGSVGIRAGTYYGSQVYNCVAANCGVGFNGDNSSQPYPIFKNCVAYNNTTNWAAISYNAACTNNATSSATDDAPGANSVFGVTSAAFVNAVGKNYHLAAGSVLIGAGVNLYTTFTTDIDGDTQPVSGAWDIGFDYYQSAGSAIPTLSFPLATSVTSSSTYPQVTLTFA